MNLKAISVAAFTVLSEASFAQQNLELIKEVARDISNLVGDTVNESDQQAHVIYENDIPDVVCKTSQARQDANKIWAFCKVKFKVTFEEQEGIKTCNLLYSYKRRAGPSQLERVDEDKYFISCIENLSSEID